MFEYNAHDATAAGFVGIVIVTREELMTALEDRISRLSSRVRTQVVFQEVPEGRARPLGTAAAVLAAAAHISGPFAVGNADDIYGPGAFRVLVGHLETRGRTEAAVIGYRLGDTLPAEGTVSRALLTVSGDHVRRIIEVHGVAVDAAGGVTSAVDPVRVLTGRELVSMNLWGLSAGIMGALRSEVEVLVGAEPVEPEVTLSEALGRLLRKGRLSMRVLRTSDPCVGITNRSDLETVRAYIAENRPEPLWT